MNRVVPALLALLLVGVAAAAVAAAGTGRSPTGTPEATSPARSVASAPAVGSEGQACAAAPAAPFVDVARDGVHAAGVDCLFLYRVARGTTFDAFRPGGEVRRDQLAAFLARAVDAAGAALPEPSGRSFDDLDGNPHQRDIERLAAAGIVAGRGPRHYDPARVVPRGQMASFLVAAHRHVTGRETTGAPDRFRDDDGHLHEPSIDAAAALGVVAGRTALTYEPDAPTNRGEIATFAARLLERLVGDGAMAPRPARYEARTGALPGSLRTTMTGRSWRAGCPVGLDDLRFVELVHHTLDGGTAWGQLVVHRDVAAAVSAAFGELYAESFGVERIQVVDRFGADDARSMAANNTSAFNCRYVGGTTRWSEHAYGRAVDLNPVQNPYVRGSTVEPEAGRAYLDRRNVRPGMLVRPGPVEAFDRIGWGWGGDWTTAKDYQHLSATGR